MSDIELHAAIGAPPVRLESKIRIFVLVVIYNCAPEDSPTLQSLALQIESPEDGRLELLKAIYDNSPTRQALECHTFDYIHDPNNGGLVAAYDWALARCKEEHSEWLLVLDQDSKLPPDFLAKLSTVISEIGSDSRIAAIVPRVKSGDVLLSPSVVKLGRLSPIPDSGIRGEAEITAINSGTALRTSFLAELGGFDKSYWLDFLDYWLFRQIRKRGRSVVVSKSVIQHNLSVRDYRANVSVQRYRNILDAESRFTLLERPRLEVPIYISRLVLRSLKQLFVLRSTQLAGITVKKAGEMVKLSLRDSGTS